MFKIIRSGPWGTDTRLESDLVLSPEDFQRIADDLGSPPIRARKIGYVAARKAAKIEVIETHSNDREVRTIVLGWVRERTSRSESH